MLNQNGVVVLTGLSGRHPVDLRFYHFQRGYRRKTGH
jgi:hypothetical protein